MKTAIVYESMFGNTEGLATSVARGITDARGEVVLIEVGSPNAAVLSGCDLLVIAAPTHALALSRPESRRDAVARGADPQHATTGVREWLTEINTHLPIATRTPVAAVFDTRVSKVRHWPGSAAKQESRILRRHGFTVLARTTFFVNGLKGPLIDGEQERARAWGHSLVSLVPAEENAEQADA